MSTNSQRNSAGPEPASKANARSLKQVEGASAHQGADGAVPAAGAGRQPGGAAGAALPGAPRLFGEMAVHKGYCTKRDIDRALRIQRERVTAGQKAKMLGLILLEEAMIDNAQFIDLLKELDFVVHENRALE